MLTHLKARHSFSGPDGTRTKDEVFTVDESRVSFLVDGGYAEIAPPPPVEEEEPAVAGKRANPKAA